MEEIHFVGEHLWPGRIGHFSVILSFCGALLSFIAYSYATNNSNTALSKSWKKIGRISFWTHGLSTFMIIGVLFYVMVNHMYEYRYAWEHVSDDLSMKYILSAFWEGQEGSFLLWMFWHIILGFIIIRNSSKWEAPVLAILALIEVVIATMILGVHIEIGDFVYRIGSNPTLLLRHTMEAPFFQNAEYLSLITGNGLNPLLQNYWMTIHPPTLFLGFASVAVPFAFTIAGLWTKDHKGAMKAVLPWALFSSGILGTGILMGGAWAYEALTFGGYWAWDPVENASLVPWLFLIGGLHTNYVANSTGYSIKATYWFYILAFVFILYSTFLTRSGVLGDTSAHAFTEMGLEWQLVGLVAVFFFLGIYFYFKNSSSIPEKEKEESIYSREFWLFIGSLVLLFSGMIISGSTSLPVFNKIMAYFDPEYLGKVIKDPIPHYNKNQLWIAVCISLFSAMTLFMRYRAKDKSSLVSIQLLKHLLIATIGGIAGIFIYKFGLHLGGWQNYVLLFACGFSIVASIDYLFSVLRGNLKLGASAVSHFGFSVMVIGSLVSGLNEHHISSNPFVFDGFFNAEEAGKYVKLIKGKPLFMNNLWVTYESDSLDGHMRTYQVSIRENKENGDIYYLDPNVVYSNDFQKVAATNPATKHFLSKDIFTNIAALHPSLMDSKFAKEMEDTMRFTTHNMNVGDTLHFKDQSVVLHGYSFDPSHKEYLRAKSELGVDVNLEVIDNTIDTSLFLKPALGLEGNLIYNYPVKSDEVEMIVKCDESLFDKVFTPENSLNYRNFTIKESDSFFFEGFECKLIGFDKTPTHIRYKPEENDIPVAALLQITKGDVTKLVKPVYVIRQNRPMSVKEYIPTEGIHIRFSNIDPATNAFEFKLAKDDRIVSSLPVSVATNVDRTDYIIFEARVFPGINLFWLGSVTMLFGLFLALYQRKRSL